MSNDKREAERAARRAKRLAERAEERARRQERQAERASERAERLAERVKRRPGREKELDQSIEDMVDEVTEKAEAWIDEQTRKLFDSGDDEREVRRAETAARRATKAAEKARQRAERAGRAAEDLSEVEASLVDDDGEPYDAFDVEMNAELAADSWADLDEGLSRREKRRARKKAKRRASKRRYGSGRFSEHWGYDDFRMTRRRQGSRSAHLYRDRQRKKICGVCAGTADYFGRPAWEMRLYAVLGLIFVPSVAIPAYFIMYFLMEDKPYYRRVTDRFDELVDGVIDESINERQSEQTAEVASGRGDRQTRRGRAAVMGRRKGGSEEPKTNNVQTMKLAKDKFSDIEQRLRSMESHVTSSRFELQRELKKIAGDN